MAKDSIRARNINLFDPKGNYQNFELIGGVLSNLEERQYIVEDLLSLNLYAYCLNNGFRYSDPNGSFVIAIPVAAWLFLGAVGVLGTGYLVLTPEGKKAVDSVGKGLGRTLDSAGEKVNDALNSAGNSISGAWDSFTTWVSGLFEARASKKSDKQKANNPPDWAKGETYNPDKTADENARDVLDKKYGQGNWGRGPDTEHNKIKKWLQRSKGYK